MIATAYVALSILLSGFYIRVASMAVSIMRGLSWVSYTKYASACSSASLACSLAGWHASSALCSL